VSVSDTDWEILERRLTEIERSLGILQACVNTSLKEADTDVSIAYALSSGSLVDAGLRQEWVAATNRQFGLVDCISTTKTGE